MGVCGLLHNSSTKCLQQNHVKFEGVRFLAVVKGGNLSECCMRKLLVHVPQLPK